ncbi:hypothetical protein Syun_010268 [Stephania yunnanensis]|uniref:Uncharacterized protein n=1 Tax=Stephania yunnanensis TaxID=152371 RepID=A0AAP0PRH4_9MAGN
MKIVKTKTQIQGRVTYQKFALIAENSDGIGIDEIEKKIRDDAPALACTECVTATRSMLRCCLDKIRENTGDELRDIQDDALADRDRELRFWFHHTLRSGLRAANPYGSERRFRDRVWRLRRELVRFELGRDRLAMFLRCIFVRVQEEDDNKGSRWPVEAKRGGFMAGLSWPIGMTTIGNSFFFLGSHLGDSLLVQYTCGLGASSGSSGYVKEEYPLVKNTKTPISLIYHLFVPENRVAAPREDWFAAAPPEDRLKIGVLPAPPEDSLKIGVAARGIA